ncbi:hypothetical protein R55227_BLOPHJLP_01601 [Fructobacillus tropaeoli]|uniref:TcpD family membrane protein n=1 Tax=Fructobacillus tropaeoli TaxID=709323 RepID=UPI002DA3EB3A|nr:hypothetical protein R55227_BLOPHJLP_01601 [Fructobacillus tropaeoli]
MELFNALKPVFLGVVVIIASVRAAGHYGKKEMMQMWMTMAVGAVVAFFINGPERTFNAFNGILNALINMISGVG